MIHNNNKRTRLVGPRYLCSRCATELTKLNQNALTNLIQIEYKIQNISEYKHNRKLKLYNKRNYSK